MEVAKAAAAAIAATAAALVAMDFMVVCMVRSPPFVWRAVCDRYFVRQCRDVTQRACAR
ncbi:Uncharacterised protein [Mycobacterium tuberculosis]|nr:Uncharacterised protein [Mycobacterium tuberculosis]